MEFSRENKYVHVQLDQYGLLKIQFKNHEPTMEEAKEYLKWREDLLLKNPFSHYVLLYMEKSPKYIPADVRITMGNWLKMNKEAMKKWIPATAYVTVGLSQKMMMKAVFSIEEYPTPYVVEDSEEKALQFLYERGLQKHVDVAI